MPETKSTAERTAKHTPGPWTCDVVIDGRANFAEADIQPQYVINRSGVGSPIIPRQEAAANARLIAAAPELLEACRRLLKFNEELCVDVHVSTHYPSADFARAAIAKAEGAQ